MRHRTLLPKMLMQTPDAHQKASLKNSSPQIHASESDIQHACIDWLNTIPGFAVWRRNVGGSTMQNVDPITRQIKSAPRFIRFGQRGEGDIDGIACHGVRLSIEVKTYGKQPTDDQLLWLDMIRRHGGIAFWVNSFESCQAQLREEFERRGWTWKKEWEC